MNKAKTVLISNEQWEFVYSMNSDTDFLSTLYKFEKETLEVFAERKKIYYEIPTDGDILNVIRNKWIEYKRNESLCKHTYTKVSINDLKYCMDCGEILG